MAVKLDQETVIKYADKVFMGLALVLLLVAVYMVLMPATPAVTYPQVVQAYESAVSRQQAKVDWEQIQSQFNNSPEDQKALELLRSSPTIVGGFGLPPIATPLLQFRLQNETMPQPVWAGQYRFAPYLAIQRPKVIDVPQVTIPALAERIAPVDLLLINDMAYLSRGQEAAGTVGYDILYVAGQVRLDLQAHVDAWRRAAARVPRVQQNVRSLTISRIEVQRRDVQGDQVGEWKTIPTARLDEVTGRPPFPRPAQPVIADIAREPKLEQDFVTRIKKYQADLLRVHRDILRPPFYSMGGTKKWISPYAWHKFALDSNLPSGPATSPVRDAAPPAGGIVLPQFGGVAPAAEPTVAEVAAERKEYTEMWFNDVLIMKDNAGKTYQYRTRVWYLNPYIGVSAREASAEDRLTLEFESQWSEPSAAVTLPRPVEFFFVGQIGERANVDLYRWIHGQWYQVRSRTFEIGEDIRFETEMDLVVPTARGTTPLRKVMVSFDPGASIIDLRDDNMMVSGSQTRVKKMIYMMQPGNLLGSLIDRTGRDSSATFWKKANETRLVEERTIMDRTPAGGGDPSAPEYDPAAEPVTMDENY